MACNGEKKTNQRILMPELCSFIAKNTSLTTSQVRECFNAYADMLNALIENDYKSPDIEIVLPKIGIFYFTMKKGRKKGQKIKLPNLTNGGEDVIILEEDEPDYEMIKFRIYRNLKDRNRQVTRKKYLKWGNMEKTTSD